MRALRSGNPSLKSDIFTQERARTFAIDQRMTVAGTVNRCIILLGLTIVAAFYVFKHSLVQGYEGSQISPEFMPYMWPAFGVTLVLSIVLIFKKSWAPFLSPVYAVCEGVILGLISAMFEIRYPGIAFQAVGITFGTLAGLLLAYKSGLIAASENLRLGLAAAMGAIFFMYLASMIGNWTGWFQMAFLHEGSPIGIAVSCVIVVVAALNLVLDFDFIEEGERVGAPKYMEWYAAFGLLVSLVWLYLEVLRLLSKLNSRR